MPWSITHYLFFFSPYFLQGIWSSNSLGKPWQRCKARIYGSADGTCAVTFASSGIFSSGKSICKTHEYTWHFVTGSTVSPGWQHVDACYTVVRSVEYRSTGHSTEDSKGICSPWQLFLLWPLPILGNLLPPIFDVGKQIPELIQSIYGHLHINKCTCASVSLLCIFFAFLLSFFWLPCRNGILTFDPNTI